MLLSKYINYKILYKYKWIINNLEYIEIIYYYLVKYRTFYFFSFSSPTDAGRYANKKQHQLVFSFCFHHCFYLLFFKNNKYPINNIKKEIKKKE